MSRALRIVPTADTLMTAAAELLIDAAAEAIAATGRFVVALSGGSTPQPALRLARDAAVPRADRVAAGRGVLR